MVGCMLVRGVFVSFVFCYPRIDGVDVLASDRHRSTGHGHVFPCGGQARRTSKFLITRMLLLLQRRLGRIRHQKRATRLRGEARALRWYDRAHPGFLR